MPYVISKKLYNLIKDDYNFMIKSTDSHKAIETLKQRKELLENSPKWRSGQDYID